MRGDVRLAPLRPLTDCDEGVIASALAAPGTGWGGHEKYPDLPAKAAALLYALAKSQACIDGNKRVALLLTDAFVDVNGGQFAATHDELVAEILTAADSDPAEREAVVLALTEWMREHLTIEGEEDS